MRFIVSGSSMKPDYMPGDKLWVSKLTYILGKPKVGDTIVLRDPRDHRLILKRILEIKRDGYFVKGNNEGASTDSRVFGLVKKEDMIGKVFFRYRKG